MLSTLSQITPARAENIAAQAYVYGYPLLLMEATEQTYLLCQRLGFYSNMEALAPALFNSLGQSKVKLF